MASLEDSSGAPFKASSLAKWFHSAPHKDLQLEGTTTIFSPGETSYREALYVLAIFIASFGSLLSLIILMFYTCCYCLCRQTTEDQDESCCGKKSCLQRHIIILALICSGALIVGFVYNGETSNGVDQFRTSVDDIQENINSAYTMGNQMEKKLHNALNEVRDLEDEGLELASEIDNVITLLLSNLSHVNKLLPEDVVNESSDVGDKVHRYDNYRWLATVIVLSWCILLCIFLFWLGCQVNCFILFMATVFCILTVLFTWTITGADFGLATGIGDFCVHPKQAIQRIKGGNATSIVISYYMDCKGATYNPFDSGLHGLQGGLKNVMKLVKEIPAEYEEARALILKDLSSVANNLRLYEDSFTCHKIHEEYMNAMDGLCEKTLNSLAVVIAAVFVIAIFSFLITCCTCPLWKHRHPHPTRYNDLRNSTDDIGNAVLWWPHDVDNESNQSFHRRYPEPNERSPLVENQPSPDHGGRQNMNSAHVNVNYGAEAPRQDVRHSF